MEKTLTEPNMAYFDTKSYVLSLSQYHCKVSRKNYPYKNSKVGNTAVVVFHFSLK